MAGIRQARRDDAASIAAIEVETWRATYAGVLADAVLIGLSAERKAREWRSWLRQSTGGVWVWDDNRLGPQGFGHCGRQRLPSLPYDGEITTLYVLPDAQGHGIGRALLRAMFADLKTRGMESALVWVLEANPSRFFYGHLGGRLACRRTIAFGGEALDALGYAWDELGG